MQLNIKKRGKIIFLTRQDAIKLLNENRREYEKKREQNKNARANIAVSRFAANILT